jgi:hypothetical protein
VEESTLATLEVSLSNDSSSQQNASIAFGYYCCEIEADAPQFNYHYTKLKGTQKMVLCKVKDFFGSGSNVSMIMRSALPKGIITKLFGDTKLVRTLAGHLETQKVVTMQDLRLPKFDKNRCVNQQKVLVFDNNNVKYNIILGTHLLSKTGFKSKYSEGTWNGLITPPTLSTWRFVWEQT